MVLEKQFINAEQFLGISRSPEYADRIVELVNGEIVELPLHGGQHGETTARLAWKVGQYVKDKNLGTAFAGGVGYVVERRSDGRDSVLGLDFAFLSRARSPQSFGAYWLDTSPDLVIEVVEFCDTAAYLKMKIMKILKSGTPLVWVICPENRTIEIHSDSNVTTVEESDTLSGGDVLPGFKVRVSDIFPA